MNEEELIKHYEGRLKTILKQHSKLVIKDNKISPIWKLNHLNQIAEMLDIIEHIYTKEEMDKIEKEDIGYNER